MARVCLTRASAIMFAHPVPRHKDQSNKGTSMQGLCSSWRPDIAEGTCSCSTMTPIKCWSRTVYGPCNWTWARKMINNLSQTFNTIMKSPVMLQNPSSEACKSFRLNANILTPTAWTSYALKVHHTKGNTNPLRPHIHMPHTTSPLHLNSLL